MDALKDFAYSLVTNSPGTSGTSITVTSGTGTLFPSAPFSATVWPAGQAPTASNAEIVRVTVVSTDTFTITRNYEGPSSPINITAGYQIAQTITQGLLNQLLPLTGGTVTGEVIVPDLKVSGLTGATTATRYVGGTANGAPTSGTFAVGDFIVDQTGTIWVCTTAGTPGTWTTTISSHLQLRSASATVGRNEITIFSGSTSSQTLTAPSSPIDGSNWTVINKASVSVSLSFTPSMVPLGSTTGVTTFSVPAYGSYSFVNYNGSQWYEISSNDIGDTINTLAITRGGTGSTLGNLVKTTQSVTVSSNAASVSASYGSTLITNNAAGSVAITMSTSGAVDGQTSVVRFLDFSAVAQTLSWVNTENSQVTVPTLSNGSTTSPLSVGFIYNGATSKWRCMATA